MWLVTQQGEKTPVTTFRRCCAQGQGGMLGVFLSPNYATDHNVYLTYSEPGEEPGTRAWRWRARKLTIGAGKASLDGLESDVARHAEGPRRPVRRADRVLARRPVPVPRRSAIASA